MGHLPSRHQMETCADWDAAVDRLHPVDGSLHPHMELFMDQMKWELLSEVQRPLKAELIKSYLESQGIEVELFQECIRRHLYPTTVDGLGRVQIFVPKEQATEAEQRLEEYNWSTKSP